MVQSDFIDNRRIRVFISSTFRDMQDERDELMKKTFPLLRQKAAERDVTLTEIDLRWGITPEESESGKVVEICMQEIENASPFFVGILGNRYGWVPTQGDLGMNLRERYSQIDRYVERRLSVTEMEMQFGVLERPDPLHAFFFIKEQELDDPDNPEKLAALKAAVRANGRYPVSTYSSPEDLARQVEEAFSGLLDELFPGGVLSELEKERIGQQAYLKSLCQNYVRTDSNFAVIDEWMSDWEKRHLVITGASGLGKSALIANWLKEKLEAGEKLPYRIVYHFVGNGGGLGSHGHVIKALCAEIRDRYVLDMEAQDAPTDEKALEALFNSVSIRGDKPLLIVLDAIDQIIDAENAKWLNWLPKPPKNVKILFSTLEDDKTMTVFQNRHFPVYTLPPLTKAQRAEMVKRYLGFHSKKLHPCQIERIISDKQCENSLVLKALLNELVNFGIFEKLDEKIESYLGTGSVEEFYEILLEGYEEDFGEAYVKNLLSLIAVSRNGLSEDEIISLTGQVPLHWSQFFCAFRQHFIVKDGLVSFAHSHIHGAVEKRYLNGQKNWETTCRRRVIIAVKDKLLRGWEEMPYQLNALDELQLLHRCLLDPNVFVYLIHRDGGLELWQYWRRLIEAGYSLKDYLPLMEKLDVGLRVHALLQVYAFARTMTGDQELTQLLTEQVLSHQDRIDEETKAYVLQARGIAYLEGGQPDLAFKYLMDALEIRRSCGSSPKDLAESFNNVGGCYNEVGEHEKALEYQLMAEKTVLGTNEEDESIPHIYTSISSTYWKLGNLSKALEYGQKALELKRMLHGELDLDVAKSYYDVGFLLYQDGDWTTALHDSLTAWEIRRDLLGEDHPESARPFDLAKRIWEEKGRNQIFEQTKGCTKVLAPPMDEYLNFVKTMKECLEILQVALSTEEMLFGPGSKYVWKYYYYMGHVYYQLSDGLHYQECWELTLTYRRELYGEDDPLALTIHRQLGSHYYSHCMNENALEHDLKALDLARHLGDDEQAKQILWSLGMIYRGIGETEKADACLSQAEAIASALALRNGDKNR